MILWGNTQLLSWWTWLWRQGCTTARVLLVVGRGQLLTQSCFTFITSRTWITWHFLHNKSKEKMKASDCWSLGRSWKSCGFGCVCNAANFNNAFAWACFSPEVTNFSKSLILLQIKESSCRAIQRERRVPSYKVRERWNPELLCASGR